MTIAQRIAQVRKEHNLSQEAFGDALGVSRQAISKWESGASLPEVEKLIAICRTYGVRIEWLLCMDDRPQDPADASAGSGELTEEQLHMVEQIAARYLEALPRPRRLSPRAKRWLVIGAVAAVIAVLTAFAKLNDKIDQLQFENTNLQHSVTNIQQNMSGQIDNMTERMEEILKAQNSLTADYGCAVTALDLAANTATLSAYAVPKAYVPGMTATFLADSGGENVEMAAELDENQTFRADIVCPLSDLIRLSVVFDDGQSLQTQLLAEEYSLLESTRPMIDGHVSTPVWGETVQDGVLHLYYTDVFPQFERPWHELAASVEIEEAAFGLFINDEPVEITEIPNAGYYEDPVSSGGEPEAAVLEPHLQLPPMDLELSPGDTLTYVFFCRDNYGRAFSQISERYTVADDGFVDMTGWDEAGDYGLKYFE